MLLLFAAIAAAATALTHTAPAPFLLEAFRPGKSLWHMPRAAGSPTIYLTFDDGPNPAATPMLLDVLAREAVPATFFLIDAHLTEETAPMLRRMFAEGHGVALHSDDRWLMLRDSDDIAATLVAAASRIEQLAGSRPCRLFRPHAGWRSVPTYDALDRLGYQLAGWSWGLWDWNWFRAREGRSLADRLARRANDGDIIVMHDGHHIDTHPDRRYAIEATTWLIPAVRARGLAFGRLPCRPGA
jgi:chitooligosaccharide deacetylase